MAKLWGLVVFFRFMVHFFTVLGLGKLSGNPVGWKRAAAVSLIGAAHAGACLIPGFSFLAGILWRLIFLCLMSVTAFGYSRRQLPWAATFIIVQFLVDALLTAPVWAFVTMSGLSVVVYGFGRFHRGRYADISIFHGGKTVTIRALVDTGNTLKDPISGLDVIVVDRDVAKALTGLDSSDLEDPIETLCACFMPGLRLIPYQSIGQPRGMLLGLRVEEIRINGRIAQKIVAFAPQTIGQAKDYQALAGGMT